VTLPDPPFLLITDRHHARGDILDVAELALLAGCRWLSLREKDLPQAEQGALLRELVSRAQWRGASVTLHGDPSLAREAGAQGVHLPAGGDGAEARRILGRGALIGLSIHSAREAQAVDQTIIDYVIAGPVFETASKPGYAPAFGPEGLATIVRSCAVPVMAIGGIDPQNLRACLSAGAAGVAVMGGVMRAKNPAGAVMHLLGALTAAES
jgi:thiamine-phosphate pyrophosphorylase